jgi:hypothetical protein
MDEPCEKCMAEIRAAKARRILEEKLELATVSA